MARSTYVYVVYRGQVVLGTFTVKHEMETYRDGLPFKATVRRFRDGHPEAGSSALS